MTMPSQMKTMMQRCSRIRQPCSGAVPALALRFRSVSVVYRMSLVPWHEGIDAMYLWSSTLFECERYLLVGLDHSSMTIRIRSTS